MGRAQLFFESAFLFFFKIQKIKEQQAVYDLTVNCEHPFALSIKGLSSKDIKIIREFFANSQELYGIPDPDFFTDKVSVSFYLPPDPEECRQKIHKTIELVRKAINICKNANAR